MTSKKKTKFQFPETDEFTIIVNASIPYEKMMPVMRWLNRQHTGKGSLRKNQVVSAAHRDAAFNLNRCRQYTLKFRVDMSGNWNFLGKE